MNDNNNNPMEVKLHQSKPRCPACGSTWVMYLAQKDIIRCRTCGQEFVRDVPVEPEGRDG